MRCVDGGLGMNGLVEDKNVKEETIVELYLKKKIKNNEKKK